MISAHKVCQRDMIHNLANGLINLFPDLYRNAAAFFLAMVFFLFQASNRRQISFYHTQNAADCVLRRLFDQPIAPLGASYALHKPCPIQLRNDLLQIFAGDLLALCNFLYGNTVIRIMQRQFQHHTQGITTFCRNLHQAPPCRIQALCHREKGNSTNRQSRPMTVQGTLSASRSFK